MAPLGSFYQLILTDQQQDDAIRDLYRKNGWTLHAKALSEQVVRALLQNKNDEIVSFIHSTSSEPGHPIMHQEDQQMNNPPAADAVIMNTHEFVVVQNEFYKDHEAKESKHDSDPLDMVDEPEIEPKSGDMATGDGLLAGESSMTETCSDTEPEVSISVKAGSSQQKKSDQNTADVYHSSFYEDDLLKRKPSVPTPGPNVSAKIQHLYNQYAQVSKMFYSTISKMSKDEQHDTEDSPSTTDVKTVKSLVDTLHSAKEAINRSCPSKPSPNIKKKQRLAAKRKPKSNRSESVRTQAARKAKKQTANTVVKKEASQEDTDEKQVTRKRTSYVGQFAVAPIGKAVYPCTYCESVYSERRGLRRHVLFKHPEQAPPPPLQDCYVCKKEFRTKRELIKHRESAHQHPNRKKRFQCKQCGDILSRPETLKQHDMILHTEKDKFKCDICGKIFNKAVKANTHKRNTHKVIDGKCEICGKAFDKYLSLLKHRKRHNLENKKHMCEHCGKSFFSSGALDLHSRTHTGYKPFKCRFCDYASSWRANTQKHEKIHEKNIEAGAESYITEHLYARPGNGAYQ